MKPELTLTLNHGDGRITLARHEWEDDEEGRERALRVFCQKAGLDYEANCHRFAPDAPNTRIYAGPEVGTVEVDGVEVLRQTLGGQE